MTKKALNRGSIPRRGAILPFSEVVTQLALTQ